MCGILGIVVPKGQRPGVSMDAVTRARDMLAHRGPDGHGVLDLGHAILAHRRLSVIDPTPAGAQPMQLRDAGQAAIIYNGELYNDAELRSELSAHDPALAWRTTCDTETVARACAAWGADAPRRLRGMFALAFVQRDASSLLLARDALGMKPLYFATCTARGVPHLFFASELPALLFLRAEVDGASPRPDPVGVSAYLTTIRTTMGSRTMFAGVSCVQPGEVLSVDLASPRLATTSVRHALAREGQSRYVPGRDVGAITRETVEQSVVAHLRSDVPTCVLLSGGLDSSIIATIASDHVKGLRTFCAGARDAARPELNSPDLEVAQRVAKHLGTDHREAILDESLFVQHWRTLVDRVGVPLSTPNETAIYEVARVLRGCGCVVTLSGEGADELLGGYDLALDAAAKAATTKTSGGSDGAFALASAAWVAIATKDKFVTSETWRGCERDSMLLTWADETFAACRTQAEGDALRAHLFWQQRTNLLGLLQRLDTATMQAGVEGRTPFADREVLALSSALPVASLYRSDSHPHERGWRTKIALREAFASRLPEEVVRRPKASFPVPFQQWVTHADAIAAIRPGQNPALESLVRREVLEALVANPSGAWHVAWPVINLALWCKRWWG